MKLNENHLWHHVHGIQAAKMRAVRWWFPAALSLRYESEVRNLAMNSSRTPGVTPWRHEILTEFGKKMTYLTSLHIAICFCFLLRLLCCHPEFLHCMTFQVHRGTKSALNSCSRCLGSNLCGPQDNSTLPCQGSSNLGPVCQLQRRCWKDGKFAIVSMIHFVSTRKTHTCLPKILHGSQ